MKPSGYLISAFFQHEERPVSFHFFEDEVVKKLAELNDTVQIIKNEPEYRDILFELDSGFYSWYLSQDVRLSKIFDDLEYRVTEIMYE